MTNRPKKISPRAESRFIWAMIIIVGLMFAVASYGYVTGRWEAQQVETVP